MTNSERTTSTADIPKGSTPLPAPVLEAYKVLIDVCAANRVPLRTLFAVDHIEKLHEATREIESQKALVKRLHKLVVQYEKELGLDEL